MSFSTLDSANRPACSKRTAKQTVVQDNNHKLTMTTGTSDAENPTLDGKSPLGLISRAITRRTGMDEDSAALISLTGVSAALGPSVLLEVPLLGKVNTSLPLIAPNDQPIRMTEVVGSVFSSQKESNYEALFSVEGASDQSTSQAKTCVAKARLTDLSEAEDLFRTKGVLQLPDTIPLEEFIDNRPVFDCLKSGNFPPSKFEKQINASFAKWKTRAEGYLEVLDTRLHPTALAEPLHLSDYEKREKLFGDGGVFSLDESGIGLLELLAASPATRRRIGKSWAASFARRPTITEGQAHMSGWLSSLSLASNRMINQFLNDETLLQTGMPQQALIIRPNFIDKISDDMLKMMEASKQFGGHLRRCLNFRRKGNPGVIQFSQGALGVFEEVRQHYEESARRNTGHLPFIQHRLVQTCKVALLLQYSIGPNIEAELSGKTLRIAHQLVKAAHDQMGRLLDSNWHQDNPEQQIEMELSILLMKIKAKGKSTRRNLGRSYHKKPMAALHPLIDLALEQGLILEDEGMLCLPGQ